MNSLQILDIDEIPIKPAKIIAEKKPSKKTTVPKELPQTTSTFNNQAPEQIDPDAEIVPPKYNFEDMIEQALG